ncbi:GldG family protein [Bradyrhizobium sp. Ash2021]|uniref:GldG family protein n=1 Tax=Bradyrhizobium sp. Ash2021 TaxID=2954771 RepID=UPI0028162C23|nr:GldG family protein [Bradyrhizobium sp. Ash2021]WMT71289.1 GldG family protein [Bradyrhizobium sp. Ash2021]
MIDQQVFNDWINLGWFAGVILALALLFAAGLKLPVRLAFASRVASATLVTAAALTVAILANVALFRHDAHLDLTHEKAFTPSAEAREVMRGLNEPVEVAYFFQKQNPAALALGAMLRQLARQNANFRVQLIDADQNPALASSQGVRTYNSAVLRLGERRVEVITTDDREIALGVLRLLRKRQVVICFAAGHGEYDIDNFEFHTHFEGTHTHSHDASGAGVVQMEQHGLGRLRRAIEKLGLVARKVSFATGQPIADDCALIVEANPRTPYSPGETDVLRRYLERGGSAMFLIEPDYTLDESITALLASAGIKVCDGVIVDPTEHYFTDEQMIAIARYGLHPATRGLALSFYPGARPLEVLPAANVQVTPLAASSADSYVIANRLGDQSQAKSGPRSSQIVALAAEGRLSQSTAATFRMIVVGDADFASNSFFPYLANSDAVLAEVSWLTHEERAPAMKPPVEVLPTVSLTGEQMRGIFFITVLLMPGVIALAGAAMWGWRR